MKADVKNTPDKKFSTGAISATVWKNTGQTKEGKDVVFSTVSLQRRYMDKNTGEWKTSNSLRAMDVPKAVLVLNKAYEYLVLREQTTDSDDDFIEEEIVM